MKLLLSDEDLKPEWTKNFGRGIKFECFRPEVQAVITAVGYGIFQAYCSTDTYPVHSPKPTEKK